MSKHEDIFRFNRRAFLKRSAGVSLGLAGMTQALINMRLINSAVADTSGMNLSNYKAMVCIFLRGGCDMNNMLIPIGNHPYAAGYKNDRGIVGVPEFISEEINSSTLPSVERNGTQISPRNLSGADAKFGMHPSCQQMTSLFSQGKLAWVNNVSTLAVPTTPANYRDVPLPMQLFSHSDQVNEWMSGISDKPFISGWGGRVADLLNSVNTSSQTSMLMTTSGNVDFLVTPGGSQLNQYTVNSSGNVVGISGVGSNPNPDNPTNDNNRRYKAALDLMNYPVTHVIDASYHNVLKRSIDSRELIGTALAQTNPSSPDYIGFDVNAIFSTLGATSGIANELKVIARLIIGRKCLGNERQMFFCDQGGYDNHNNINSNQPNLLGDLDAAVGAFNQTMEDYALFANNDSFSYDQVVGFEMSDFDRTWTPNGDSFGSSGTDHAWGTHTFVFGGAVQAQQNLLNGGVDGGRFFGSFPALEVGGPDAVPNNSRGRWIPSTSTEQFSARLANWFGAGTSELNNSIFPNLPNFTDPFDPAANLDFLPQQVA